MMVLALALETPTMALADPFPQAATGAEVRGDDGTVIGRVTRVQRDSHGRIVAVEIPGLEPADAPRPVVVAQDDRRNRVMIRGRGDEDRAQNDRVFGEADRAR